MKRNWKNIFGGSRSLFFATFTGPGDIFLQSLSFEALVEEIASRIPRSGGSSFRSSSSSGETEKEGEEEEEEKEEEEK
jgi:hypothetical protein